MGFKIIYVYCIYVLKTLKYALKNIKKCVFQQGMHLNSFKFTLINSQIFICKKKNWRSWDSNLEPGTRF